MALKDYIEILQSTIQTKNENLRECDRVISELRARESHERG